MAKLAFIAALLQMSAGARIARKKRDHQATKASHKPLCDAAIVAETCGAFTEELGKSAASIEDIANSLFVTKASAQAFLQKLGLDGEEVACQELCRRTVQTFPEDRLPPASFLSCEMHGSEQVCDLDLSPQGLAAVAQSADPHRFHPLNASDDAERKVDRPIVAKAPKVPLHEPLEASFDHMQEEVAHWFGIWTVLDESGPELQGPTIQGKCGTVDTSGCSGLGGSSDQAKIDRMTLAYLVEVEKKIKSGCGNLLKKWFGSSKTEMKNDVISGLQFVSNTVKTAYYVNWKDYAGYYGWVYPGEKMNGNLVIHFGKAYFTSGTADRIGTITHEAMHHPPLRRRDRQHRRRNGPKQYCDVPGCLGLAKSDPAEAQLNDDNWSFFIDDLVGGGMDNNLGRGSRCAA